MGDIEKGLPIRTEDDPDQYTRTRIFDETNATQGATVDTDKNLHVETHGNDPAGADKVLRLSQLGAPNGDGDYDAADNTKPDSSGLVAHDRTATPNVTHQNKRITGITDNTVHALDVALHDEAGVPFGPGNPLPTVEQGSAGTPVHDFDKAVNTAAGDGSTNHDYSVADGDTFRLCQILAAASGRAKFELQIGDGAASEVFVTKAVWFQSEQQSDANLPLCKDIVVVGTANTTTVRVIKTNRDDLQTQDIYTTVVGSTD